MNKYIKPPKLMIIPALLSISCYYNIIVTSICSLVKNIVRLSFREFVGERGWEAKVVFGWQCTVFLAVSIGNLTNLKAYLLTFIRPAQLIGSMVHL